MSAYVVSKEHIDVMVQLGVYGPSGLVVSPDTAWSFRYLTAAPISGSWSDVEIRRVDHASQDEANAIGDMLARECVRSVLAYSIGSMEGSPLPGPLDEYWRKPYEFEFRSRLQLSAVEGLSAIDCYEYQSSEHREWWASEALRYCTALRKRLVQCVNGYDAAPWEWTEERIASRMYPAGSSAR